MTTTSNIFVGISAWAPSTSYAVGNRRSNGGNAYQCIIAGTSASSGGPAGTGSSITDGGATWKYLAHVDYVTLSSWASGIPGALTQPIVGLLWDCGAITTTAGTAYLTLSGHTTSATNTITLKPAPGEGIRDFLATGVVPLAFNASLGVRFVLPNSTGNINYFVVNDNNVIIEGLQVQDPLSTSNSSLLATRSPGSLILRDCIFDGYPQPGGAGLLDASAPVTCYNCLFVDRTTTEIFSTRICFIYDSATNSRFVNCTFISIAAPTTSGDGAIGSQVSGSVVKNCAFFGFNPVVDSGSTVAIAFDHCGFSNASPIGGLSTDGGGNKFSLAASNQFTNPASDWRIKAGSALILAGTPDSTDVPSSDDIAGHTRLGWDPGAWEYTSPVSGSISFGVLRASASASLIPPPNNASSRLSLSVLAAHGTATETDRLSGAVSLLFMRASAAATLSSGAVSGNTPWSAEFSSDFGPIISAIPFNVIALISSVSPVGIITLQQPVTAASSFNISASSAASVSNASAQLTFLAITATGQATQLGATANIMTMSCVSVATPLPKFVGSSHIDWQVVVSPLKSSTNSHTSSTSILVLTNSAAVTQGNSASGQATISLLSVSASIGASCSALVSLPPITPAASAGLFDLALGVASIIVLSTSRPAPPLLLTDNNNDPFTEEFTQEVGPLVGPSFLIAADGSGLILAADIFQPAFTSSTSAAGLASISTLVASAASFFQVFWSGSVSVERVSATAQLQQINSLSGTAIIPSLSAVGSSVQRNAASGAGSLERLTSGALLGQKDTATGLATIPPISAFGSVPVLASALAQVLPISGAGFAGVGNPAFAFGSLETLNIKAFISDWSYGSSSWTIGVASQAAQFNPASAARTVLSLATNTSIASSTNASAVASVEGISAVGLAGQINSASGISTLLPMACVATSPDWCLATNTVFTLSAAGFGGSGNPAFLRNSFFALSSVGTGTAPLGSTCVATMLPLAAAGAISLGAIGSASIGISSTASLGQSDGATASGSINFAGAGFISNWCAANASVGLSASGSISQTSLANGAGTIQWSASGQCLSSSVAACVATVPTLSASAHAGLFLYAVGLASLPSISAIGAVSDWAYGSATIPPVRSTAAATQLSATSGSASIPPIVAAGSATLNDVAAGLSVIPTLSVSGTAVNDVRLAQATKSIMALAASATAAVNGASIIGSASIGFIVTGVITSAVEAAVLVELEQIVAAHAKLWVTPTGYEQGDQVVWWSD